MLGCYGYASMQIEVLSCVGCVVLLASLVRPMVKYYLLNDFEIYVFLQAGRMVPTVST